MGLREETLKNCDLFLKNIKRINAKKTLIAEQESIINEILDLPVNNKDLVRGLFRVTNSEQCIKDLIVFHGLTESIDRLRDGRRG